MKTKKLRCEACNGIMEMDSSKSIIFCPYCGSKELIEESDNVKKKKIQSDENVKKAQITSEENIKKAEIRAKNRKREQLYDLILTVCGIICICIVLIGMLIVLAIKG